MEIRYRPRFRRELKKLGGALKTKAFEREEMFRANFFDSRLHTHKLHGPLEEFWAFSVDGDYRIIFAFVEEGIVEFYSIGNHDIYD